jgi:hypothetical protein
MFWVCVWSLRYLAWNTHLPYCHLWPAQLYNIFLHYLINGTIFEKKKRVPGHKMCVLIFSTTFVWNISHSKKNWARYIEKCILVFMQSTRYSCLVLMKLEFSRQVFEKHSNIKFNENPCSWNRVVPCERTDGRTRRSWQPIFEILWTRLKATKMAVLLQQRLEVVQVVGLGR